MSRLARTDGLTDTQREILGTVHDFEKVIIPNAQELEHADEYPAEIVEHMKEMGVFGLTTPEQYGAKYLASEYCRDVVEDSFRIHGGYRYCKEYEIERLYREAPMLLIGEGTADIQRMIIGRRLLESYKRALRAGTAMDSNLSVSVADGVARLTFQRPEKRNAITAGMWSGISEILQSLVGRDDVRCLAVQGSGGCFSAGADLAAVRDASGSPSSAYQALVERGLRSIREFRWPTLAVIEGPCIGGGCAIALACDVRFAVPGATFTIPAVRYGLELEGAALVRLVELVGSGQASRFLLSAMTIRGAEAAAMGLVDLCANNAFAAADEFLDSVAAADPATVAKTVAAIRMAARTPVGALEAVNPVS